MLSDRGKDEEVADVVVRGALADLVVCELRGAHERAVAVARQLERRVGARGEGAHRGGVRRGHIATTERGVDVGGGVVIRCVTGAERALGGVEVDAADCPGRKPPFWAV